MYISTRSLSQWKAVIAGVAIFLAALSALNLQLIMGQVASRNHSPIMAIASSSTDEKEEIIRVAPDPKIIIPSVGIDAPVVYGMTSIAEPDVQRALQDGVLHYANSPKPGQPGNSVYVGHSSNVPWAPGNYKFIFAPLEQLQLNEIFHLNYEGIQYTYRITSIEVVMPDNVSVLASTDNPTVTLITCTPIGTNLKRLVIKAEQISPTPAPSNSSSTEKTVITLPGN